MTDRAFAENRNVRRAAADIDQHHAEFLFVFRQHRERRRERLQDQIVHFQSTATHALDDVLRRRDRSGDDVHLDFEPHAAHAERLAHSVLPVDDEFLGEDVQDLLVGRNWHGARGLDRALHVDRRHLLVLDRYHPGGVEALDVAPGDARENALDLAVGHQFRFFERALDGVHGRLDVYDHALFQALGFVTASPDDVHVPVREKFRDHCRHLGGADVQSNDEVLVFPRHVRLACERGPRARRYRERGGQSRWDSAGRRSRDAAGTPLGSAGIRRRALQDGPRRGPCPSRARVAR